MIKFRKTNYFYIDFINRISFWNTNLLSADDAPIRLTLKGVRGVQP